MKNVSWKTIVLSVTVLASPGAWSAKHSMENNAKGHTPVAGAPSMEMARMREVQNSMMKMHDLMHQMQNAKTPAEREKLQQQHMQLLQSHLHMMMPMMQGMGGHGSMPMNRMPPGQPR